MYRCIYLFVCITWNNSRILAKLQQNAELYSMSLQVEIFKKWVFLYLGHSYEYLFILWASFEQCSYIEYKFIQNNSNSLMVFCSIFQKQTFEITEQSSQHSSTSDATIVHYYSSSPAYKSMIKCLTLWIMNMYIVISLVNSWAVAHDTKLPLIGYHMHAKRCISDCDWSTAITVGVTSQPVSTFATDQTSTVMFYQSWYSQGWVQTGLGYLTFVPVSDVSIDTFVKYLKVSCIWPVFGDTCIWQYLDTWSKYLKNRYISDTFQILLEVLMWFIKIFMKRLSSLYMNFMYMNFLHNTTLIVKECKASCWSCSIAIYTRQYNNDILRAVIKLSLESYNYI